MKDDAKIIEKFWKALRAERTVMLGLVASSDGHSQPMTAQVDGEEGAGTLWFFTSKETDLARTLGQGADAALNFVSKDHDVFACLHGRLVPDNDPATIDRLWNRFVAAWFEGGKQDPKLQLLRMEPDHGQVWLNEHSLIAGVKILLGRDPKEDYKDKVAEVDLRP